MNRVLRLRPLAPDMAAFSSVAWPALVSRIMMLLERPQGLKDVLRLATKTGSFTAADVLRAVEILTATRLAAFDV
jgi:hypothetical protein